jgi:hypothetical protein
VNGVAGLERFLILPGHSQQTDRGGNRSVHRTQTHGDGGDERRVHDLTAEVGASRILGVDVKWVEIPTDTAERG